MCLVLVTLKRSSLNWNSRHLTPYFIKLFLWLQVTLWILFSSVADVWWPILHNMPNCHCIALELTARFLEFRVAGIEQINQFESSLDKPAWSALIVLRNSRKREHAGETMEWKGNDWQVLIRRTVKREVLLKFTPSWIEQFKGIRFHWQFFKQTPSTLWLF